ncbi:MAG: hypothetical protein NTU88_09165, partial [Armatimonadetes bacterium]|nr:hypothetical protein [Armatimonadota bacterium]
MSGIRGRAVQHTPAVGKATLSRCARLGIITLLLALPVFAGRLVEGVWAAELHRVGYLRHDESFTNDRIQLKFTGASKPSDKESRSLGLDLVRFIRAPGYVAESIDIGTPRGDYWLAEGWHDIEKWDDGRTMHWADGSMPSSSLCLRVPRGTRTLDLTCCAPGVQLDTEISLNGYPIGSFQLPANSGWRVVEIPLPQKIARHIGYHLSSGGPLSISRINWIDAGAEVCGGTATAVDLTSEGHSAAFPVDIPERCADTTVLLTSPAPTDSRLEVWVNSASAVELRFAKGNLSATTEESDALERQADIRTKDDGWGESFNYRISGSVHSWPKGSSVAITPNVDSCRYALTPEHEGFSLFFNLPEPLAIEKSPYLSVKLRASKQTMYFVRPEGETKTRKHVLMWHEDAATDDRAGTGDWETLTFSLPMLARSANTQATHLTKIVITLVRGKSKEPWIELDWLRVHRSLAPNAGAATAAETDFGNHLDDDMDGLTDKDDRVDYGVSGFGKPLVMCWYHPWFGSRSGKSRSWSGWRARKEDFSDETRKPVPMGMEYNPDEMDPACPGKRNVCTRYYPLDTKEHPHYEPPETGLLRYDLYGGLEAYDCLSPEFVETQLALAKRYGIDGFAVDTGGTGSFEGQVRNLIACAEKTGGSFYVAASYDWYYRYPPFNLMEERSEAMMAKDIALFRDKYGASRSWLRYAGRPAVFAAFRSGSVSLAKWETVARMCALQTKKDGTKETCGIALFLDSREAASSFDGYASYGPYLGSSRVLVSDPSPGILTVSCGYDDRKIRHPGHVTDREDGALYSRQWESAL